MPLVSSNVDLLLPEVAARARALLDSMSRLGHPIRITETVRTEAYQAQLYAVGRVKPGTIVTHAEPSTSLHEYGRAFDITFHGPGYSAPESWWALAGQVGESLGLRWGGRFPYPDRPHFEL